MREWYIEPGRDGGLVARARATGSALFGDATYDIPPGEAFLGVPFRRLRVGDVVEERNLGEGWRRRDGKLRVVLR